MIVIHCTDNTAPAKNEAQYATRRPDQTSAHFYVDGASVYQALPLTNVAFGCYPIGNSRSIQFEIVGKSNAVPTANWKKAAKYVAICCKEYGIPITKVTGSQLRSGRKGICGHGDVTNAWGQGDHTDPGSKFPWSQFIREVKAQYDAMYAEKPKPKPPPTTGAIAKYTEHKVVKGDSLWAIALTYYGDGTKYKQIAKDSGIKENSTLRENQVLKIRQPHKTVHVVVKGETAYGVAKRFGIPLDTLKRLNAHRVSNLNQLAVGVVLRVK
jgi:LysM repeat protein